MAHWDDEQFKSQTPPKDVICATCKYRLKPVTIMGQEYDRSNYATCGKYELKPMGILLGENPCSLYQKE